MYVKSISWTRFTSWTGEELQTLAQEMVDQPAEVIDRVKRVLAN